MKPEFLKIGLPTARIFVTLSAMLFGSAFFLMPRFSRGEVPQRVQIRELKRSGNTVTLEITLPKIRFDTLPKTLRVKAIHGQIRNGDPLAAIAIPLRVSRNATVAVSSHEDAVQSAARLDLTRSLTHDIALDGKSGSSRAVSLQSLAEHHGIGYAKLHFTGTMRAADISSLELGILDAAGPSAIRAAKKITITISDPGGLSSTSITDLTEPFSVSNAVFKSRIASGKKTGMKTMSTGDVSQVPGIQSDDGNVYRMYIRQYGIYHITFSDLQHFGIDPTEIDPATLRIVNNGEQIAVYVYDIHNDGHFHSDNYFEFFGTEELYHGDSNLDFYYDPYTQNNVYYLVWGSHYSPIPSTGVKRMVEESGEIRTSKSSPYPGDSSYVDLRDSSYLSTYHYEKDVLSDPLNISDVDQPSDIRDHTFTAILATNNYPYPSTYTDNITIPFPDIRSSRPVSFRAALQGISDFDPGAINEKGIPLPNVDSEDDALIRVNNFSVLHGVWDSQTLKFLSSDTASQRVSIFTPLQLFGGNPLDTTSQIRSVSLEVTQQKQTGVNGCRFGFDWLDITYDRAYYAYQDTITFRAPQFSTAGLYQFTVRDFGRTDISIYRKGVSKISNVAIVTNPNRLNQTQAIFQLHITSAADEFFAVTDSEKLKPYKYEKDNFLGLHAPNNSGEYLIITNRDHLAKGGNPSPAPLEGLLSYRESHNHVSGKLIDVANIYDEFNDGIRSPRAIKKFLTYAYQNWQDPPKYVLLVGATHQGTDDTVIYTPNDQVPAPYIQAYLEGAVAADQWYSMLDGDLIPDIVIGRLASQTTSQDAAYITKLEAAELDAATPGDWKDRALFIGAGPSFDNDIEQITEDVLPKQVSVMRESTVPFSAYTATSSTLFNDVNNGLGYIAYFGHGGAFIWDDPVNDTGAPVLANSDVQLFSNTSRYPIILSMTCFTGIYDGSTTGVMNTMLLQPNAGSIAALGTTSFGWQLNDEHLAEAIVPDLFDSVGGSVAERITNGKMDFLAEGLPGDLLPPTLVYCYHFLGDPLFMPYGPSDKASLTLSSRVIQPGGSVQLSGTSSITNGIARIELVNNALSPLSPPHVVDNIPVTNGTFSYTDQVPSASTQYATYRATIYDKNSNRVAATAEDVTVTASRVTELAFNPNPVPTGVPLDFSAAVQSPNAITTVTANFYSYRQSPNGTITVIPSVAPMSPNGDRYHTIIPASSLNAGDKIVASVTLVAPPDSIVSDSIYIVVDAAGDPSVCKDSHHRTLTGKIVASPEGPAWQERIYNWGSAPVNGATVTLLNVRGAALQTLGSTTVSLLPPHSDSLITIPLSQTALDSVTLVLAIAPSAGTTPLNLRDSTVLNDSTLPMPSVISTAEYSSILGTTLDGANPTVASFNTGEANFSLPGGAEGNVSMDVLRLVRQYAPIATSQPDIHFLPMYTDKGAPYAALRITSDSLGAIALTPTKTGSATLAVKLNVNDSLIKLHANDSLYIYRLDDRSKLWTILPTARSQNTLTASLSNLGMFAIAYNTDTKPPLVDLAVEGEVLAAGGEVPPQPHIDAILQDANGIDITPGKTVVKIDNRLLSPSEYTMLDSGRTQTTVNLTMQPSLSNGTHVITVQATDDNGKTNAPPKELDCKVSNQFGITVLGTFPNPFTRQYMFLAYQISGIAFANSVQLDIYTVSGRRIRTMDYPSTDPTRTFGFLKGGTGVPTSLGYHEVWWDGRDDGGSEVANGVYFYRLTVVAPASTQQLKGKFARLR